MRKPPSFLDAVNERVVFTPFPTRVIITLAAAWWAANLTLTKFEIYVSPTMRYLLEKWPLSTLLILWMTVTVIDFVVMLSHNPLRMRYVYIANSVVWLWMGMQLWGTMHSLPMQFCFGMVCISGWVFVRTGRARVEMARRIVYEDGARTRANLGT